MTQANVCIELIGCLFGQVSTNLYDNIIGGIVGGIVTAFLVAFAGWGWRKWRQQRMRPFAALLAETIRHRNLGKHRVPDSAAWVQKAKRLEGEAEALGSRLVSPATGILVRSLGDLVDYKVDRGIPGKQKKYVGILSTVIDRMQAAIQRHDR